jgi:hypothetical protein
MNRTIPSLSWNTRILVCTIPSGTESEILRSSIFKSGLSASMTFFTSSQCLLRSSGHKAFCVGLVGALIMPRWPKQNKHDLREETVRTHEVVWWTYLLFISRCLHMRRIHIHRQTQSHCISPLASQGEERSHQKARSAVGCCCTPTLCHVSARRRTAGAVTATPSIPPMHQQFPS